MNEPAPTRRANAVATTIVMVSTFASRILGFVRIAVIGAVFGASGQADVLNLVFSIPNNLRKLLAEGALSSAFLPVLSRSHLEDPSGRESRGLVSRLLGLQLVLLVPLLLFSAAAPQVIVDLILDFPERSRQLLAADLFRYLIHYVLLVSVAAVFMGVLNSHHSFLVPAVAPLWFSVSVITAVIVLHRDLGIFSMVVGVLVGGLGHLLIQVPPVLHRGYSLVPRFDFRDPRFRLVIRRWLPVVSTASVFAVNQQVALFFASGLADGSGSALSNALVFWQLPFGIFSASITTVLFPAMSRHAAEGDTDELRRTVLSGLRGLLLLLIPAGVGLMVLGESMIAVALQRGAFTRSATVRAAQVLSWYSVGLFSVGAFTFLQRFFYACDDYRTPLWIAGVTVALDIALSLWLKETRLGVAGLAAANSIAFSVGLVIMLLRMRGPLGSVPVSHLGAPALRGVVASAAAAGTVRVIRWTFARFDVAGWHIAGSNPRAWGLFFVEAIPAGLVLLGVYAAMGIRLRRVIRGADTG